MKNTKQQIIAAAIDLFCEKGIDKTSMQNITDSLQMGKGTIYFHFSTKEQLVNDVYEHCYQLLQNACIQNIEDSLPIQEKLFLRFINMAEYVVSHPKESMVENLYSNSVIYSKNVSNRYYRDVEDIIKKAITKKELTKLPLWAYVDAYYGVCLSIYNKIRENNHFYNEECIDSVKELLNRLFVE